jgi:hypothetical protein
MFGAKALSSANFIPIKKVNLNYDAKNPENYA